MSVSVVTGVAYRDGGFLILSWLLIWLHWISGRRRSWPPRGFVGKVCSLSAVTDRPVCRLSSTRLHRAPCIPTAPRWRLTCAWQITRRHLPKQRRGLSLGNAGSSWATVGVDVSARRT